MDGLSVPLIPYEHTIGLTLDKDGRMTFVLVSRCGERGHCRVWGDTAAVVLHFAALLPVGCGEIEHATALGFDQSNAFVRFTHVCALR